MNKFLVIVPTLNSYLLLKLIKSLKLQTWPYWKIFIIDGDSTEKHINWVKKECNKDKRILCKQKKNF